MVKRFIAFSLILSLMLLSLSSAVGGSVSDPVVTYSYVTQTFKPQIISQAQDKIEQTFSLLSQELNQKFGPYGARAAIYAAAFLRHTDITFQDGSGTKTFVVGKDAIISGTIGTMITMTEGSAYTYTPYGDVIVNISDGNAYMHGNMVIPMSTYMIADPGQIGIRTTSEAIVTVSGNYCIVGSAREYEEYKPIDPNNYTIRYTKYAHALNVLGLFRGSNIGFELERKATRAEAITMLIRILGEEQQALSYTGKHPFKDVPNWADRYVAYAYNMGYTTGMSATQFGSSNTVTAAQYLTFLLRALGYSDANGDFVWSEAVSAAVAYGVLTPNEERMMRTVFFRDQMVLASYKVLFTNMKGTYAPLYTKLLMTNAITMDTLYQAEMIVR